MSKNFRKAFEEVARLKAERDPLDKVLKQRQADYEKSMVKHAEFPSIPEVQNMHRNRYAERVRRLDANIQKATDEVDKTFESMAQILWGLSSQTREPGNKATTTPSVMVQHQETAKNLRETAKKQQAEINDLKTQMRQMQTQHSLEKDNLQVDFTKRCQQMKEETDGIKEMMREMKKEMKKEMKRELLEMKMMGTKEDVKMMGTEEEVKAVKKELRGMREELEKRQTESRNNLQSQLAKQEKDLRRTIAEQLVKQPSEHKTSSAQVPGVDFSVLIQQESSARVSDVSNLLKRVDELTGQLAQQSQDTISLRTDLTTCYQQVENQVQKVDEHESKLSNVDFNDLEGVAETMSLVFPNLQRKVESIQTTVDKFPERFAETISDTIEAKQDALLKQVQQFLGKSGKAIGDMVDGVQRQVQDQGSRIKSLEGVHLCSGRLGTTDDQVAKREFESISSDVTSIKTDLNSINTKVGGLAKDYLGLSEQVNQVDLDIKKVGKDLEDQLKFIRHSVTVLDTRFNNLSTRELAEQIIGQLEQVYPNARQLIADMDGLKTRADGLDARLASVEERIQERKATVDKGQEAYSALHEQMAEPTAKHLYGLPQKPQKRRRIDPDSDGGPNDTAHPVANVTGQ